MNQVVRIIGGHHRGKKIAFPNEQGLRPTPSRIRETLFNWIMHDVRDATCLDAFAGSGALGFEAWSRGAQSVTLLEQARPTFASIKKQAAQFDTTALHVIQADACAYLQGQTPVFDLIFLDPPFNQPELLTTCIKCLETSTSLRPGGLVYTESSNPVLLDPSQWETRRTKKAGQVVYALHQKHEQT